MGQYSVTIINDHMDNDMLRERVTGILNDGMAPYGDQAYMTDEGVVLVGFTVDEIMEHDGFTCSALADMSRDFIYDLLLHCQRRGYIIYDGTALDLDELERIALDYWRD